MCTWESRYNLVIGTTFERKASARLSSWLKSIRDSGERPDWMLPHVFDELGQYWNTYKFKAISDQAKMARGSLKGGSLHTGGAKTVGTVAREMIWKEKVVGGTHKGRCYGLGSRNNVRYLQLGLEELERKRVAEQQSMSETVQQIKEQVMNLARRPTTSAPDDTDDESDEDDYVDLTP
ncbi:hypothetical protein MTR67_018575 [Solanum verrucosum]|uniref:Uncharacterized protein n=1 Tax=Solanum verrucosum TaxID=315347 RepID=A0AAF0QML2_SOLVR|nr:hypothetical protein MTR67_018575 [Solanum verrucosum]